MITITCQHTGIEFQAETRRSKNHPRVTAWLEKANKSNAYGGVLDTIAAARANGAKSIEDFENAINAFYAQRETKQSAYLQEREESARKIEDQKAARKARNKFLNDNGYTWTKFESIEEDEQGASWHLYAPDGIEVSVAQALDEINRGREVVRAEIEAGKTYPTPNLDLAFTIGNPMLSDK